MVAMDEDGRYRMRILMIALGIVISIPVVLFIAYLTILQFVPL